MFFQGNWLEWRQLFSGESLWWGGNFLWGRAIFLRGNCPGCNYSGAIIQGAIIREAIIRGAIFLGDNCPRTYSMFLLRKNYYQTLIVKVWLLFLSINLTVLNRFSPNVATGSVLKDKNFSKISQNSQENTCAIVYSLIKLQPSACFFIKEEALGQVISSEFCEISKNIFLHNASGRLLLSVCHGIF